jgi:hypothetical protein
MDGLWTSSTDKTDPKSLPGPALPYCPGLTGIVETPVPWTVDHRVTVAQSLSPSRNSDNEKFASVVKLARFCSPGGRPAPALHHRRPAPWPQSPRPAITPSRSGNVMAGAGGAAGPVPDVRHQPPDEVVYRYFNFSQICIYAASTGVKATEWCARGPGFKSDHTFCLS